jgi:TetR/AcrR family transcriptional repressor of uid operon
VQRFVVGQLRREQAAGTISPTVDVDLVAEVWVRLSASFLAIPSHVVDLDDPEQLRGIARNYLVPMLTG